MLCDEFAFLTFRGSASFSPFFRIYILPEKSLVDSAVENKIGVDAFITKRELVL